MFGLDLGTIAGYAIAAAGAFGALLWFGKSKKDQGRAEERAERNEDALDVKQKMDDVPEPGSDDTVDRLRDNGF